MSPFPRKSFEEKFGSFAQVIIAKDDSEKELYWHWGQVTQVAATVTAAKPTSFAP